MATVISLPYALPRSSALSAPAQKKVALSASVDKRIALASPARGDYESIHKGELTFSELDIITASRTPMEVEEEEEVDQYGNEAESREILSLDPKDWKNHDMYEILGLDSLRYDATPDQIKRAHYRKVLRHHPDKKASTTGHVNDDSFFKCIQKAFEVLMNPETRRQFDSADTVAASDDSILVPEHKVEASEFFEVWGPVFEREARFSTKKPVPLLGTLESTKPDVEEFYDFWFKFDSWRSFEWLDKDVPEGRDSRDDKRHAEKKNRADRAKRKNEDNQRLHDLVDKALSQDPRIKLFRQREKEEREKKRKAKANPAATPAVDAKKAEEEAAKKKEEESASGAATPQLSKKEREAQRKREQKAKKAAAGGSA